jgi:hypothetical protein
MISAQDHHCYVRLVIIAISAIGFRIENLLKNPQNPMRNKTWPSGWEMAPFEHAGVRPQ